MSAAVRDGQDAYSFDQPIFIPLFFDLVHRLANAVREGDQNISRMERELRFR